jgi:uncharacterized protein
LFAALLLVACGPRAAPGSPNVNAPTGVVVARSPASDSRLSDRPAEPTTDYPILLENRVAVTMRDGTKLYADVYRPKAAGKFPVLLQRDPYDRRGGEDIGVRGATHGYVVVLQDVRGRYDSQGEWYPLRHEAEDGYDTVEWAASLPYSDGRVGMLGASYRGSCALLAAVARPPHLVAIHPVLTPSSPYEGLPYLHGVLQLWWADTWSASVAYESLGRSIASRSKPAEWVKALPVGSFPFFEASSPPALVPYFRDWLAHPAYDDYWRASSIEEHYDAISVPAYHVGGWYDVFLRGTLRNYLGLRAHAATEAARRGQRLLIGPWNHIDSPGEVPFGEAADRDFAELRWFDYAIKGMPTEFASDKPVQIFVMGKNAWRGEDDWPLERAKSTRYRLHASGVLDERDPGNELPDSFRYDPNDPVPTRGGAVVGDPSLPAGPADQRPVESRKDVLVWTTRPFDRDVEVTGPVSIDLFVSSTARDTDFTAKLVDVWPNGFAQNLTDGIVRMRFRESREHPSLLEPGKVYEVTIDLAATSDVLFAGHRLRVDVSSSDFPRFDRNLSSEESPELGTRGTTARNTIYHDAAHPSALVVSVVPPEKPR